MTLAAEVAVATRSVSPTRRVVPLGLPVPPAGPGVCSRCHGPTRGAQAECWCCRRVGRLLDSRDCGPSVVPAALCRPGDELHAALRRYKDAPAIAARRHFGALLASVTTAYLHDHGPCLAAAVGRWESVAVVPSSHRGDRAGASPSPFDVVVAGVPALMDLPRVPLGRGPAPAGHLHPSADAFAVRDTAVGRRVLLVDDTWVTGARARSAAAALAQAGASVVAVLVVGRAVDPGASLRRSAWWEGQRLASAQRAGRCCLPGCRAG